ncbi:XdhC family protein [Methylibium sp.]|uniref:XdhC family protein n=1 Tax=Methylibium sp. TaxID=2067992 RepID=UPI003D0F50D5
MTTSDAVFAAAQRLQSEGTPYALVSVVRALPPASARPGDKAVVTQDGHLHGWVGGGCAQPAVIRTVRQVLSDGKAKLIRISPATEGSEKDLGDILEFGMSCHSGGTLELFVDPVLPAARLVVIGTSPVALSLAQLAPKVGFSVTAIAHEADPAVYVDVQRVVASDDLNDVAPLLAPGAWVVVATQGRRDVQALRLALGLSPRYVAFVASARKAKVLKDSLIAAGSEPSAVQAIVAPAGYPMAATTPEEIALSVLAAVVSNRRGAAHAPEPHFPEARLPEEQAAPVLVALAESVAVGGSCCHSKPTVEPVRVAAPASCCGG